MSREEGSMPLEQINLPAKLARIASGLLLSAGNISAPRSQVIEWQQRLLDILRSDPNAWPEFLALIHSNHVIVRTLTHLVAFAAETGSHELAELVNAAFEKERARIGNVLPFLTLVCSALEQEGCEVIVIKSLDHWPDFGSDLDLFTTASATNVIRIMKQRLNAQIAPRSWGDHLASKWNFLLPGLPEPVEIHIGRLGQTGEQVAIARALPACAISLQVAGRVFRVPVGADRLLIATLQRMYRHFYLRLCDVVDSAALLRLEAVDYGALRRSAEVGGIWSGVATYLALISGYAGSLGEPNIVLPDWVRLAAQFGADQLVFRNGFLRVPILPHSASLYFGELTHSLLRADLRSSFRIGLLPYLATAAAVGQKITGSDKGIW